MSSHDEMTPLIMEIGHSSFRAGFGGEVVPEFEMPSCIGALHCNLMFTVGSCGLLPPTPRYLAGKDIVYTPREGMELVGLFDDSGNVTDWGLFDVLLTDFYERNFPNSAGRNPVLFIQSSHWRENEREKLAERMFEGFNVPYLKILDTAVLSCYANAVTTSGIVVDSGAAFTCISCVKDGLCLRNSVVRTTAAGNMLDLLCYNLLRERNIPVVEPYRVGKTCPVPPGRPPIFSEPSNLPLVTDSYGGYMKKEAIENFKRCVIEVSMEPLSEMPQDDIEEMRYKFPAGNAHNFGVERYHIGESLFDANSSEELKSYLLGDDIVASIQKSIWSVDKEHRGEFLKNVIVTGGTSMLPGFIERMKFCLTRYLRQPAKLEVLTLPREFRRHSPFMGASFYTGAVQVESWLSQQEYKEFGNFDVAGKAMV